MVVLFLDFLRNLHTILHSGCINLYFHQKCKRISFSPHGQTIWIDTNKTYGRTFLDFPDGSDCKESTCNVGDLSLIPGMGKSPRGGHGNPLQYSCLENPHRQRSLAGYSPWGRKELDMIERLSILPITTNDIMWFSGHWWWAWPSRAWPDQDLGSPLFPGGKETSDSLVWSLDLCYTHLVNVMFL